MPAIFTMGEKEDIVERRIRWMQVADVLEISTMQPENDISMIRPMLCAITWNDSSDFIIGCRKIIVMQILISISLKANSDIPLLISWIFSHNLKSLLVEKNIRMSFMQHGLQLSHDDRVEVVIPMLPNVKLCNGVMYIDLGIDIRSPWVSQKRAREMVKCPLDVKAVWTCSI